MYRVKCRGVIVHEGKLLVVRHPQDPSFAALPGGKMENGEDPKQCVARELQEELGVEAVVGRLLYVNLFTDPKENSWVEFFFEVLNPEAFVNFENNHRSHAYELAETAWVGPDDGTRILPEQLQEDLLSGRLFSDEVRFLG